ncbi:HTH domain-containing protein [Candidatus Bipolaricaulota bacterium]|nr:HTH domain-containing protein [Candidatus Bipolaricaulota bacterium]MBS3792161.1 HTH domain-containing protein [Candidatus Bipolaricaulota bacterium]
MENYVIPDVVQKFSGVKVELWHWLEENIGNQNSSFEINQSKLAEKFEVSRKSIQNALKTFQSANLIEKVESRTGRGVHPLYRLIWTFREKSATPSRVEGTTPRKIQTKGRLWRYFAYKFRTVVEDSSLANKSQVVVGKILNFLEEKPPDMFREWLIYLRNWLDQTRTLKDFFVYFHQTLRDLAREKRRLEETNQLIERQRKQRREVQAQYEEDPPPKSSDFSRFGDYLEAMEAWGLDEDSQLQEGA